MFLCREVRFSAFLLSCIVVLLGGSGAFGTEAARGVSACTWPTPCSFVVLSSDVPGGIRSRSIAGEMIQPLSFGWLRDDRVGKGLLSQISIGLGGSSKGRPTRVHANVVRWPVSKGYVQWARPPPARSPSAFLDEMELSSDFRLLARRRRRE